MNTNNPTVKAPTTKDKASTTERSAKKATPPQSSTAPVPSAATHPRGTDIAPPAPSRRRTATRQGAAPVTPVTAGATAPVASGQASTGASSQPIRRIKIAIDMHLKSYRIVRQLDHTAPEPPQRFTPEKFYLWLPKQLALAEEVYVCYEAGCFGYEPARRMEALGVKVLVIAPQNWDERGRKQVNDKFDARVMCTRLSDHLDGHRHALSIVRIPSREEEQRRDLARQREQIRGLQRQSLAMGRSLLLRHERPVTGKWWRGRTWASLQNLSAATLRELERYRAQILLCEQQAAEIEEQLVAATRRELLFYGEGALSHELIAREMVNPHRFQNGRQVSSYCGLCPSESTTSENRRMGSITKHGNPRLRRLLVELAWRVARRQPTYTAVRKWAALLSLPAKTHGAARKKAIVALARQLAVDLWRVATGRITLEELGLVRSVAELPLPQRPASPARAATPA